MNYFYVTQGLIYLKVSSIFLSKHVLNEGEKKEEKNVLSKCYVGRSFALLPNMKCTIYLFQTTLEGIQYNNSYFWYLKKAGTQRWS